MLKAIGAGQGDYNDVGRVQHELGQGYNAALNNRAVNALGYYNADNSREKNLLDYNSAQTCHYVTDRGNQLTADNTAQNNSWNHAHQVNQDSLANKAQEWNQYIGTRDSVYDRTRKLTISSRERKTGLTRTETLVYELPRSPTGKTEPLKDLSTIRPAHSLGLDTAKSSLRFYRLHRRKSRTF
jgi:hypothetical protein